MSLNQEEFDKIVKYAKENNENYTNKYMERYGYGRVPKANAERAETPTEAYENSANNLLKKIAKENNLKFNRL